MPKFEPHEYQRQAIDFIFGRLFVKDEPGAGLFLDPGLGKTGITLKVIEQLKAVGELQRALIVAPLRVCHLTWPGEIFKWEFDLSFSIVHGRRKAAELHADVDINLINPDGLPWLVRQEQLPRWGLLVVDESTKFKNWSARRTKALRKLIT